MPPRDLIQRVFEHAALPPKLPGSHDENIDEVEVNLLERMLKATKTMKGLDIDSSMWDNVKRSLRACKHIHVDGSIDKAQLTLSLRKLAPGNIVILHIMQQNAGLLIRRESSNNKQLVIFEAFEASPRSENVLASQNALLCDFPDAAAAVPLSRFLNDTFVESLASFLVQASSEFIEKFAARAKKAGVSVVEIRDTVDPALIREMLINLLEGLGERSATPILRKRIRDEVNWDNSKRPWRRSPFWLVLRVCVQRLLALGCPPFEGRLRYKLLQCLFYAQLLSDGVSHLSIEDCHFLRAKLCRRLAKLEAESDKIPSCPRTNCRSLFDMVGCFCEEGIQKASSHMKHAWGIFKNSTIRQIPSIPYSASDEDLRLTLPNSLPYLKGVLKSHANCNTLQGNFSNDSMGEGALPGEQTFAEKHFDLARSEANLETLRSFVPGSGIEDCARIGRLILAYIDKGPLDAYSSSIEQRSLMVLVLFETWIWMDICALNKFPLLKNYHSGFHPEILDVLHLSRLKDVERLHEVQRYLDRRQTNCQFPNMTIFSEPHRDCFAFHFFDTNDGIPLRKLRHNIQKASDAARNAKEVDRRKMNKRYDELTAEISNLVCCCAHKGRRRDPGCKHCLLRRQRNNLRITIHEDFLPGNSFDYQDAQQKAILLELAMPESLAVYRDATWKIISLLREPSQDTSSRQEPKVSLRNYNQLQEFSQIDRRNIVGLASTAKSFLVAHYAGIKPPASKSRTLLPFGLRLSYYDHDQGAWCNGFPRKISIAHNFRLDVSVLTLLEAKSELEFEGGATEPSSYEILSSQTRCPSKLTVHEFMAYQNILVGQHRLWPSILREIGSSNLNFSLVETMHVINHRCLQSGPRDMELGVRMSHAPLIDPFFCGQLLECIERHLESISGNWRESYHMELLVTIILRVCSVGEEISKAKARQLLRRAQAITLRWTRLVHKESQNPASCAASVSEKLTIHALMASLICKRTFLGDELRDIAGHGQYLRVFIEASIVLQDNLPSDKLSLPSVVQGMLIRDLHRSFDLRAQLSKAILILPQSLEDAINSVWPVCTGCTREYRAWRLLDHPHTEWIVSEIASTEYTASQTVHYHVVQGDLLIDKKPLGRLPSELRDSRIVKQLFGNQRLLTYPSALPTMTYTLASLYNGHEIHFGIRGDQVIVRARVRDVLLEFIDKSVFAKNGTLDMPAPLIEDCVHWLNLSTREVEFRTKHHIWIPNRSANWVLDVKRRRATRRTVALVDPHGALSRRIMEVFRNFEDAKHVTVFQPSTRGLTVELRRMNLHFTANTEGRLVSKELRCEISPGQDSGTWFGLESMLVLREVHNPSLRSIIVPLGQPKVRRNGPHVAVQIVGSDGVYGRFFIDDVVGRVQCAPEPVLMFTKALLHAYTSFILPDPLTKRTGTEEALALLSSSAFQPWAALRGPQLEPPLAIAHLSPRRVYYPDHLKCQQMVSWNCNLTTTIQDDKFRQAVDTILTRLKRLGSFYNEGFQPPTFELEGDHLRARALIRRRCYAREFTESKRHCDPPDDEYIWSRTRETKRAQCVFEVVQILDKQPMLIHTTPSIASLLEVPVIQGYHKPFNQTLLTELLDTNIARQWGPLIHSFCRPRALDMTIDRLIFTCGVMAFGSADMGILRTIVALALNQKFSSLPAPEHAQYKDYRRDESPSSQTMVHLIRHSQLKSSFAEKRDNEDVAMAERVTHLANRLVAQWPRVELNTKGFRDLPDPGKAKSVVKAEWSRLLRNMELSRHLSAIQEILDEIQKTWEGRGIPFIAADKSWIGRPSGCYRLPSLSRDLMAKTVTGPSDQCGLIDVDRPNSTNTTGSAPHCVIRKETTKCARHIDELEVILKQMTASSRPLRKEYAEDLLASLKALTTREEIYSNIPAPKGIQSSVIESSMNMNTQLGVICDSLASNNTQYKWLQLGQLWPCLSATTLLPMVRSRGSVRFGTGMREAIIDYGVRITVLQRLLRMEDAHKKNDVRRIKDEEQNQGHGNWNPNDHSDWLLFEIDANILIRDDQIGVARATMSPTPRSNSVLQMNMGKGKTSVILPIVACAIANGQALARLVVPRALLVQTAQILQARLGGLVGREICHLPFSRKTPLDETTIQTYRDLYINFREQMGIMLTQPDHILSFKLSGLQALADNRLAAARNMISVQSWLEKFCRDVIDESDFTLAVKTQLVYPSGTQLPVDGHPYRWKVPQALLGSVQAHLHELQVDFAQSIEVFSRPSGGFPFIYILRPDVEYALHERLVADICDGKIPFLPAVRGESKDAVRFFLLRDVIPESAANAAYRAFPGHPSAVHVLHIIRGLLVHGILSVCLRKRWNVQYGLHPRRDPVAIPYYGKGIPSDQAEWGHPDVAIMLTCLAFYYSGLTIDQLRQSLRRVLQSDDPPGGYARWTHRSSSLPMRLRQWNLINADDEAQVRQIWSHLRYEVIAINDYLNAFVFPVHARKFQYKIQASGWDIPHSTQPSSGVSLTTGFSGTNDNKRMLPLTIEQRDLPELFHTNAEVLSYLLQTRNRGYLVAASSNGKRLSEVEILRKLKALKIRILIDAGAHILELDNESLVRQWLKVDHEAPAGIYFNADNKAAVIYRNGKQVPLLASPFADDLSSCLVYLDEAHTRGTDLKLPVSARGALTLSLGQTKDHTVQAAMRLRQLGVSQTVIFMASPEVHRSILDHTQKAVGDLIDSSDVISWLLEQTCKANEDLQPLYLAQGFDFCKREHARVAHLLHLSLTQQQTAYVQALLQPEQQTLEQLYSPVYQHSDTLNEFEGNGLLRDFWVELSRQKRTQSRGNLNSTSTFEEVEQERELAVQVEEMRQPQKPKCFPIYKFPGLDENLLLFVKTGAIRGHHWYRPLFSALWHTDVGRKNGISSRDSHVLLSREFTKTIFVGRGPDFWHVDFLRPVHWILWSPQAGKAVVIIPEEAEVLIPILRNADRPVTYLIVYAAPLTREMLHFETFRFYTIPKLETDLPPTVKMDLGILAGRLYFKFEDYGNILDSICPHGELRDAEHQHSGTAPEKVPRKFLEEWFALTRKGQDFTYTPMGYVCQGRKLSSDHPFFASSTTMESDDHGEMPASTCTGTDFVDDEEVGEIGDVNDMSDIDDATF
ncbi:hypothetical protein BO78DRAFT_439495 [Aspergillus sclerotiicarbonarius CBS 121057]|uniref:ubiquitinyl hydrolase 1 n=1 Tax=Aspergillus sclerotiicarbonarius (strain CBS 121057 / IBT 28362) TaxID=1448318 RepID=A0A319DRG6_ASPSB|nr:hypothetical protein BO78DRAFT_439495 [Aspergillus sclerotiicarbonarius CBS 121057]